MCKYAVPLHLSEPYVKTLHRFIFQSHISERCTASCLRATCQDAVPLHLSESFVQTLYRFMFQSQMSRRCTALSFRITCQDTASLDLALRVMIPWPKFLARCTAPQLIPFPTGIHAACCWVIYSDCCYIHGNTTAHRQGQRQTGAPRAERKGLDGVCLSRLLGVTPMFMQ